MRIKLLLIISFNTLILMAQENISSQVKPDHDVIIANGKSIGLWFVGHGSLMIKFDDYVVHIDPVSEMGNYNLMPGADLILISHHHSDHLDLKAIKLIEKDNTKIIANALSVDRVPDAVVMKNGDTLHEGPLTIEAVPAYNLKHKNSMGNPFHPKGEGNGYIISFEGKRIYIAGDTENIPEMAYIKNIDIAFLPMNLPYTMTPEMVAEAVGMIKPVILYPYHYGSTNTDLLLPLVDSTETEIRIRDLK